MSSRPRGSKGSTQNGILVPASLPSQATQWQRNSTQDVNKSKPATGLAKERCRQAAKKCRRRQRTDNDRLTFRVNGMEATNLKLHEEAASLREQVLQLKHSLLEHTTCACTLIHKYISAQAARAVRLEAKGKQQLLHNPSEGTPCLLEGYNIASTTTTPKNVGHGSTKNSNNGHPGDSLDELGTRGVSMSNPNSSDSKRDSAQSQRGHWQHQDWEGNYRQDNHPDPLHGSLHSQQSQTNEPDYPFSGFSRQSNHCEMLYSGLEPTLNNIELWSLLPGQFSSFHNPPSPGTLPYFNPYTASLGNDPVFQELGGDPATGYSDVGQEDYGYSAENTRHDSIRVR